MIVLDLKFSPSELAGIYARAIRHQKYSIWKKG